MNLRLVGYIFIFLGLPFFLYLSITSHLPVPNRSAIIAPGQPYLVREYSDSGILLSEHAGRAKEHSLFDITTVLGAAPFPEDRLTVFPQSEMQMGGVIDLYRAPIYTVVDGKKSYQYRSWAKNVGELFSEKKIEIGDDDKVSPALNADLNLGMKIVINRVAKTTVEVPEPINFSVVKQFNNTWEKGQKAVIQKGVAGVKKKYYLVTREDGVEISRQYLRSEVATAPINEIDEVGTKVVVYGSGRTTYYAWPAMESKGEKYYAASKTIPKGTVVWVVNTANGKGVRVTVLDRVGPNAEIDLSPTAFATISTLGTGVINARIEKYYAE
ncbi:MAG: G5 domain-containing protein [Candidatus Berkelbacteria bacterium]